jgi:RNA polymerase sigma-70 factor (ECF subfamily)
LNQKLARPASGRGWEAFHCLDAGLSSRTPSASLGTARKDQNGYEPDFADCFNGRLDPPARGREPAQPHTVMSAENLFATTRWSVVLEAAEPDAPRAAAALDELCRAYWKPLYVYVRRCGHGPHDAEDLTQGFLAGLLANHALRTVAPVKGRFRSFLLASLKHYLANEWDKARTQKRGNGHAPIALDDPAVEQRYLLEPVDELNPERIYDRHWAFTVLDRIKERLRAEYAVASKSGRFGHLAGFLPGESRVGSQADAARALGTTEGAFKVEVHRLRQRYRQLLREEVARTVGSPDEIDEELRHLIAIVSE